MKTLFITSLLLINIITSTFAQIIVRKNVASLPEGYCSGEAVNLKNEIYFVTGRNDSSRTSFFYKFNPKENQRIKLADVPGPAMNLAIAAVNGKIYVIG